jgi:hypothetical protein
MRSTRSWREKRQILEGIGPIPRHRIPRMPSVSHDANLRFQMARRALGHYVVRGTCLRRGRGTSRGSAQLYMCVRDVAPRASKGPLLSNTRPKGPLLSNTRPDSMTRLLR